MMMVGTRITEGKFAGFSFIFYAPSIKGDEIDFNYTIKDKPRLFEIGTLDTMIMSIITDYWESRFLI